LKRTLALTLAALACARPERPAPQLPDLQSYELARAPSAEVRALLRSSDGPSRARAALAAGRIGDRAAVGSLEELLQDPLAGEVAAWALGRIEGDKRR
jgi:HEAT repeat protein